MHFRGCVIREVIRRIEDGAAEVMEDIKKMEGEEWDGTIPEWMEPGFIKPADVEAILKAKAGAGGSQGRRLRTKKAEAVDAARHVVSVIYEQLSKTETSARRRIVDAYFGKNGHLYVDWSVYPVVSHSQQTYVSQTDMEAIFPKGADAILQLTLSSISEASVTSADKNARTADRENNAKYGVIEAKLPPR